MIYFIKYMYRQWRVDRLDNRLYHVNGIKWYLENKEKRKEIEELLYPSL